MLRLTLRDFQFRATRFGLVIVGTSVVFALLLLMGGLANHFVLEATHAVDAIGADTWVLPKGVSGPFTSASAMDPSVSDGVTGAERADPIVISRGSLRGAGARMEVIVIGHVLGGVVRPRLVEGKTAASPGDVVLDQTADVKVGSSIRIGASAFVVTGLTQNSTVLAGLPFGYMSVDDAQQAMYGGRRIVSAVVTNGRPDSVPDGFAIHSRLDVAADTRAPLKNATKSIDLVRILLWVVSGMIIGGVVYLSSMERRRDFAVLKAVGADSRALLAGLAIQSAFVALAASAVAAGLQALLVPVFPLAVEVAPSSLVKLPVVALIVSLAASAAGMRQVARTDPAAAFSAQGS